MKKKSSYVCQQCGNVTTKWNGKCGECNTWGSIIEDDIADNIFSASKKGEILKIKRLGDSVKEAPRFSSGVKELDRVLGGGFVEGSSVLIGGSPGIGKSTLLLQVAGYFSQDSDCLYVTGEESVEQISLRAKRLSMSDSNVCLAGTTSVADIVATIKCNRKIRLLIIDSIQTMYNSNVESTPGTISQVRASANELISVSKGLGVTLVIVGHVTKEGQIAGPKLLEHMVDAVLYFEETKGDNFRIIRTIKNRFGPANEIGVFEIANEGLLEVANPSSLFLSEREDNLSGSVVFAGIEGSRPILVEIQALVVQTNMVTPRRAVVGWDVNRLAMVVAILRKRYGLFLGDKEIYLNVAGGLKIQDPAADLAVAVALISATIDKPVLNNCVIFGELSLSGAVREVSKSIIRLNEASKLGFKNAIISQIKQKLTANIEYNQIININDLHSIFRN